MSRKKLFLLDWQLRYLFVRKDRWLCVPTSRSVCLYQSYSSGGISNSEAMDDPYVARVIRNGQLFRLALHLQYGKKRLRKEDGNERSSKDRYLRSS